MDELIEKYRDRIKEIARQHGATSVGLFGSFASGKVNANSDIDLLVEMAHDRSLLDLIAIKHGVEDLTHRQVDVVTHRALSPHIAEEVIRSAQPL